MSTPAKRQISVDYKERLDELKNLPVSPMSQFQQTGGGLGIVNVPDDDDGSIPSETDFLRNDVVETLLDDVHPVSVHQNNEQGD